MFQKVSPEMEKAVRKVLISLLSNEGVDIRSVSSIPKNVYYNILNAIQEMKNIQFLSHTEDLNIDPLTRGIALDQPIKCTCTRCYKPFAFTPLEIMQCLYIFSTACPYCFSSAQKFLNETSKDVLKTRVVQNATLFQGFRCDTEEDLGVELKKVGTNSYTIKEKTEEEIRKAENAYKAEKYATNNGRKLDVEVEVGVVNSEGLLVKRGQKTKMSNEELAQFKKQLASQMNEKKKDLEAQYASMTKEVEIEKPLDVYKADDDVTVHSFANNEKTNLNTQSSINPEDIVKRAQIEPEEVQTMKTSSLLEQFREDADEFTTELAESHIKNDTNTVYKSTESKEYFTYENNEFAPKVNESEKFNRYLNSVGVKLHKEDNTPKISNEALMNLTGTEGSTDMNDSEDFSDLKKTIVIEGSGETDEDFNY